MDGNVFHFFYLKGGCIGCDHFWTMELRVRILLAVARLRKLRQ